MVRLLLFPGTKQVSARRKLAFVTLRDDRITVRLVVSVRIGFGLMVAAKNDDFHYIRFCLFVVQDTIGVAPRDLPDTGVFL